MPNVAQNAPTSLGNVQSFLKDDFQLTNKYLKEKLSASNPIIPEMTQRLVSAGGKRIRPMLCLLMAKLFGYQGRHHAMLATVIELLHTATLLHDDVVDGSSLRRGKASAHRIWGNKAAILVGDFLYSRCFEMMTEINAMPIMRCLAKASNAITQGEVEQLVATQDQRMDLQRYLNIIEQKTAHLFIAACEGAAILSGVSAENVAAASNFGKAFGMAYQLIDDCLDYHADPTQLDKHVGDDLAEGKLTLPMLYGLTHGSQAQQATLRAAIESKDRNRFFDVRQILQTTGALSYAQQQAQQYSQSALRALISWSSAPAYARIQTVVQHNLSRVH